MKFDRSSRVELSPGDRAAHKAQNQLYRKACQLSNAGQAEEAMELLAGHPELLAKLEDRPDKRAREEAEREQRWKPYAEEAARYRVLQARPLLASQLGVRAVYTGKFVRLGSKSSFRGARGPLCQGSCRLS